MSLIERIRKIGYIVAGTTLVGTIIASASSKENLGYQNSNLRVSEQTEVRRLPSGRQDGNLERTVDSYVPEIKMNLNISEDNKIRKSYESFSYPNELEDIMKHAKRVGVEPELLMAIRDAEDGADDIAYGILPGSEQAKERYKKDKGYELDGKLILYKNEKEKQLCNAAWTIRKNIERFEKNPERYENFISYLANKYAPRNVKNDPKDLNDNWELNVRILYKKFKGN